MEPPGKKFTRELCEDDGKTLEYEKQPGSTIRFAWNDKNRVLTIEPTNSQVGKVARTFNVQLIAGQRQNRPLQPVQYRGGEGGGEAVIELKVKN